MAIELKNFLSKIDRDIEKMDLISARRKIAHLQTLVETDKWLDDDKIKKSADLISFTKKNYQEIAWEFQKELIKSIENSIRWEDPFLVRVTNQALPPRLYSHLTENFPMQKFLQPRKDAHFMRDNQFQRYESVLTDIALKGAGHTTRKLWLGLRKAFEGKRLQEAICNAVGIKRPHTCQLDICVMVDRCGFNMKPHTDGGNGAVLTYMMYFPPDGTMQEHGTEFFLKQGNDFKMIRKRSLDANSAHAFAITQNSWHGLVTPIPEHAERRRSLVVRLLEVD